MGQLKIIVTRGIPASGKTTWANAEVAKDPLHWVHINNDALRLMCNGNTAWSQEYEKIITNTRKFMIKEALKRNLSCIVDNVNADNRHWDDLSAIAKESNKDVMVFEKLFPISLEEAIARDAARTGTAKVGAEVVTKFWKKLGGKQFFFAKAKVEIFTKNGFVGNDEWKPMEQDETLTRCVVFDNDGTISLLNGRNPYDASTADQDLPHPHVIECMKLYHQAGYKIIFVSGRDEKDRAPTERFYQKHFPEVKYELYMRPTGDQRRDVVIKKEIYDKHIKGKWFCAAWYDDRHQIVKWLYDSGFPVFRVGNPEASF